MRATIRPLRTNWWYLTVVVVVLAVLAAGVHTMSIAAPALAEQQRLAEDAEAAAERAVVPGPAAADGMPVPALLGGIVLAFAVGLSAGHVSRRRRLARRASVAQERPAPEPTPAVPARPAPPPPEPVTGSPRPVELAAPQPQAPPPPPAPIRAHGPRILRFRAAPAPPPPEPVAGEATAHEVIEEAAREPADDVVAGAAADELIEAAPADEIGAEEPEIVAETPTNDRIEEAPEIEAQAPADEVVEEESGVVAEAPADEVVEETPTNDRIEEAPEVVAEAPADEVVAPDEVAEPARADEAVAPDEVADEPVADAPAAPAEALGSAPELPRQGAPRAPAKPATPLTNAPESVQRPGAEPVLPARRFARAQPWPKEAETLWTCEIAWKAGYLKSTFRAMAGPPGAARRKSIGESPSLRWTLMTDPEPPTPEMIASVKVLISALVAAGWERTGPGGAWYAQRFVWRGSGEPRPVVVPDELESAQ